MTNAEEFAILQETPTHARNLDWFAEVDKLLKHETFICMSCGLLFTTKVFKDAPRMEGRKCPKCLSLPA